MIPPNGQPSGRTTIIYCDGACIGNPGPGGFGVLIKTMDGYFEVSRIELAAGEPDTTNNRQEMKAAIEAIRAIPIETERTVIVRSDSKYVIDGITQWINGWKARGWRTADRKPVKNEDLWRELDGLASFHDIAWQWVKGHAGDPDNERVDQLANAAAIRAQQALDA